MDGEITRKSVLIECLQIMREELDICSKKYNGLEPKEGMEEAWQQARQKVQILQELIQAYDSEPVRAALANWQREVMEKGPKPLNIEDLIMPRRPLFSQRQEAKQNGYTTENLPGNTEERQVPCREDFMEPGPEVEPIRI